MVKAYVCKAAEWVTREAMQIHGGMGYAEEFPVSRLLRRRPRAVDLRRRRRDALPQGDRPPARRPLADTPRPDPSTRTEASGGEFVGESVSEPIRSKSAPAWSSYGSMRIGWSPAAVAAPMSIVTESPT